MVEDGNRYILLYDSEPEALSGSAISLREIGHWLQELAVRQAVVFVDACFSDEIAKLLLVDTLTQAGSNLETSGRVIITAGGPGGFAYEDQALNNGVFTHYLLEGLAGGADLDSNGMITV